MTYALLLLGGTGLLQVTPGSRAQQLNAEGAALIQLDRAAEAELKFRQALQADPNNVDATVNVGVALFKQGRFAESIPFFQRGVSARPRVASVHNDLAQAYVRIGRPHAAAIEMAQACDLDPQNVTYRRDLGDMLLEGGDRSGRKNNFAWHWN